MAELMLRKVDSPLRGLYRGDVVESRPNGFRHTALELANYTIVRVRDQDAAQFLQRGTGRKRAVSFDLDAVHTLVGTGQGVKILTPAQTTSLKRNRSAVGAPPPRRPKP